jgi:hypothetical protein
MDQSLVDIILPDTGMAAMADDTHIYTYVQLYYGELVESISTNGITYKSKRILDKPLEYSWENVKPFTPLAATFFDKGPNQVRYLFYLNRQNVINDLVNENGKWREGNLGNLGITTADYSKLAAVTLKDPRTIYVYYQGAGIDGGIHRVHGHEGAWRSDRNDYNDPPLFGTSLAAVLPGPGLVIHEGSSGNKVPVVFYQEAETHDLPLAELEDNGIPNPVVSKIKLAGLGASPHTPLAAVLDFDCYAFLFYTSDENEIRRVKVDTSNGKPIGSPLQVAETTPKGNIAAITFNPNTKTETEKVYVYYQPWYVNLVTQAVSNKTRNCLHALCYDVSGSGDSKTWSNPQILDVTPFKKD